MIHAKNPNQRDIFDPWDFLTPKRRQMLEAGWPGLFRQHILPSLPVGKVAQYFTADFGRPTKELYSVLGALVLQQAFDLTDEQTVEQFAFNIQWHYGLNITEESDATKYISPKTLWNSRNTVAANNLEEAIFKAGTDRLKQVFNVDVDKQRIDSVHIKSNMRRLSRIGIFSESIHKFLVNLKRHHGALIDTVQPELVERYLSKKALGCFAQVKPSESKKTLGQVSKDLFDLVEQFKAAENVADMYSFKLLQRVLAEHCNLTVDPDKPVELKKPAEIASDSLQNPSDPDASYSGHKGQGYTVQVMETFCTQRSESSEKKQKSLNLITHVDVKPAHHHDAHALMPAIEDTEQRDIKPKEVVADALYGSDDNCQKAQSRGVELTAPAMGKTQQERISLSDFEISEKAQVIACPQGHAPAKVRQKKRQSIGFAIEHCERCPLLAGCPVKKGKKFYYLRFKDKELRIAARRSAENCEEFKDRYRWRAGAEATMSEYDRRTGVKHLRVRGHKAVRFCATIKALAVNIFRAAAVQAAQMMPEPAFAEA